MVARLGLSSSCARQLLLGSTLLALTACGDDSPGADTDTAGEPSTSTTNTVPTSTTEPATTAPTSDTTSSADSTGPQEEEEAREEWPLIGCDPLVPSYCSAPFPSNAYTVEADTPTGRRVELAPELLPMDLAGLSADPTPWNALDGFSAGIAISTHFPALSAASLTASNVATATTIPRSLEDDSPTVLLNASNGERVPHWVDLDATDDDDANRLFMIRPAIRLDDSTRYIVVIRGLQDDAGAAIPATDAFAALRDRTDYADDDKANVEAVEGRRALYGDIFIHTTEAGLPREDMQLAWDFTTSSSLNNTAWMVHMRDEALEQIGEAGPSYTITSVDEDWDAKDGGHVAFRIFMDVEVPMYLDQAAPLATLQFGDDGMPEPNGMGSFEVELLIPQSATTTPAAPLQYGHGLLGDKEQIQSGHFQPFIDEYNYALFSVDFIGFASDDEAFVGAMLGNGRFHEFAQVMDRQHQGMLNSLVAMRLMKTSFANDETYGALINPDEGYYLGISQGGIYGPSYMALSTDITRGCLGVPGMPYNVLLSRSVDFDIFFDIIRASFPDARDHMMLLNYAQMLWDRMEPTGYVRHVRDEPFPGTEPHEVFLRAAVGDHQVTNFGAHIMARSLGVPHLDTGIREIWGLESQSEAIEGSAYVEYSFGLPEDPVENTPQRACEDPHGKLRRLDEARLQLDTFFRTGRVENTCAGGVCEFADLSGCE